MTTQQQRDRDWEDRPDLTSPMAEICKQLGFDPAVVSEIRIEPSQCEVTFYLLNDAGMKHIRDGFPVMSRVRRKVRA